VNIERIIKHRQWDMLAVPLDVILAYLSWTLSI
jgi:hypothetical protein